MKDEKQFIWKGKVLLTMGDVMRAACQCRNQKEAQAFLDAYRKITAHADQNIGFMSGYLAQDQHKRLLKLFAEEAYKMDRKLGLAHRKP